MPEPTPAPLPTPEPASLPPATPESIQQDMHSLIEGLQAQLDALNKDIFAVLPGGARKYTPAERAELNNLRSKLVQEIFHRQVTAAFDAATFVVIRQPSEAEIEALKTTLVELGKPIAALTAVSAVVGFVEDLMTKASTRLNALFSALRPKTPS